MHIKLLPAFLYSGLVGLTIGTLFYLQRWPFGQPLQVIGVLLYLIFFVLLLVEVWRSRKAKTGTKVIVSVIYLVFILVSSLMLPTVLLLFALFIAGSIYLRRLRSRFLFVREGLNTDDFDSLWIC